MPENWAAAWAASGIETWVVSLVAVAGVEQLANIAVAGGTERIEPTDPEGLRASLEAVFTTPCP